MVLTVTLNPSVDRALFVDQIVVGDANRVIRSETDAGGKGINLSRVLCELGGQTIATGFIAGGPGAYICRALDMQGLRHAFVEVKGETRTNVSVEDSGHGLPTTFNERGPEIDAHDIDRLFGRIREHIDAADWITVGGSLPPGTPPQTFRELVELAHSAGKKILVDADGEAMRLAMEAKPDMIKPNEKEAARLLGQTIDGRNDAIQAAESLYDQLGGGERIVVVSRGAGGAAMVCADGTFDGVSPNVEMKSTIGCGDSMLGGMLWAIQNGLCLEESLRWGLAAGAATASTDGTEIARKPVVDRLFPSAKVERDSKPS
jgi:1-phosphofructokinase family hexose kinase